MVAPFSSRQFRRPRPGESLILRRLALAIAAVIAVFALAGCVTLQNVTPTQVGSIGDVQITGTLCVSGSTPCPGNANTTVNAGNNAQNVQLFVAYRVPVGVIAPSSLRFTGDIGNGPVFTPNASYTAELQRLAPVGAGQQWLGYTSSLFVYTPGGSPTTGSITATFRIPKGADGLQAFSTFSFRMAAGTRAIDAMHPITAAVACGNNVTDFNSTGSDGQTVCIDSPSPATLPSNNTLNTHDALVRAGTPPTTPPGTVAGVPFSLQYSGSGFPSVDLALTATTTIPGSTPSVTPGALSPTADSTTPVLASVPVPAGTRPGTYPVTLTAKVGTETRVTTSSITVTGSGGGSATGGGGTGTTPALSGLSVSPKFIGRRRSSKPATIKVTLSQAGTLRVAVARAAAGRRKNGRCVAPTRTLVSNHATRCTRYISVTTLAKTGQPAGARSITFSGRGRSVGAYRLTVTVRSVGGLVSLPKVTTVYVTS